jgi:alanyl-tRNA synthetase
VSFSAVVVDIREEGRVGSRQRWQLLLNRTEFSAGLTGTLEAVSRSGARLVVQVLGTIEENGEMWHRVEKPLMAGTEVTGTIEGEKSRHLSERSLS